MHIWLTDLQREKEQLKYPVNKRLNMKHSSLTLLAVTCPLLSPPAPQRRNTSILGRYLATLKPESSPAQLRGHTSWIQDVHARTLHRRQPSG